MPTQAERLASLETAVNGKGGLIEKVDAVHEDVKLLVAAHNAQKGAARLLALLWAGLLSLGGVLGGMFVGKHG